MRRVTMFKKILIGLVLVVGVFLIYAATRPGKYHVERSTKMAAPAPVVYAQLEDLRAFVTWAPWVKKEPDMKKTFGGVPKGVGASYAWEGKKMGKGKMVIVET